MGDGGGRGGFSRARGRGYNNDRDGYNSGRGKMVCIARMRLRILPTLPGLLALEIVGRRLREILSCDARRLTHLLVVLGSPLVTSL
jgi:hypothetical protein